MSTRKRLCVAFLGLLTLSACTSSRITGVIPADWPAGIATPVAIPLGPDSQATGACTVELTVGQDGQPKLFPAQYEPADPADGTPARVWFFFCADADDQGQPVTIRLHHGGPKQDPAYRCQRNEPLLDVTAPAGEPVLSYWHGPPDCRNPKGYPLNDFIHPLFGLDGEMLTANSPADHIHHRGIFWAWVRHERKGKPIGDWWIPVNIRADSGSLAFSEGPALARFAARHFWVHQPPDAASGERFLDEYVVCRVFKTTDAGRAIDIDLSLKALDDGVRIGGQPYKEKGYGGLTVRFGEASDAQIVCDQNVIEKDMNGLRAVWVDWTGVFAGPDGQPLPRRSGGALFVHPDHPDCPPTWITRFYGPINVSYPGMNMLTIPRDEPLRLRYRLWIHRGDTAAGKVAEHYRAYAADFNWKHES